VAIGKAHPIGAPIGTGILHPCSLAAPRNDWLQAQAFIPIRPPKQGASIGQPGAAAADRQHPGPANPGATGAIAKKPSFGQLTRRELAKGW